LEYTCISLKLEAKSLKQKENYFILSTKNMADPQKNQTPEVPTQELPETTLGIKKIREDIVALKLEANALEDKRKDFEKNKKTLPKEESDKIKQEIDAKAKYIEEQKEKLSALLKQTKGELAILK
jgi:outer membrane translocation and assembly module TamA